MFRDRTEAMLDRRGPGSGRVLTTNTTSYQLNEYAAYLKKTTGPPAATQTNLSLTLTRPPVGPVVLLDTPMNMKVRVLPTAVILITDKY